MLNVTGLITSNILKRLMVMSSSRMRKEFQAKVSARAEARAGGKGPASWRTSRRHP